MTYLFVEVGDRLPSEVVLRNCGSCMVGGLWLVVLLLDGFRTGVAIARAPPLLGATAA